MPDLSILIPSRNELFLRHTIDDILAHAETDIEVIVILDGSWPIEPIPDNPRVILVHHSESIGQRAACNEAARISQARYVMKCDAHCAFDQGFDRILLEDMEGHDDWCMVPIMRNLHVFDWVCPNEHRRYQSPSGPCLECGEPTKMDVVWIAKTNPQSTSYCFDSEPHFQYFKQFKKRPEGKGEITETMSLQGSCWLMSRELYFRLGINDESFGSWGSQGIEVAVKVWLSGGRVVCNHRTWYAHMFRTQGGDFGFPYPISGQQVAHAKNTARDIFFNNRWEGQVYPLSWLVERFWPVPGWTDENLAAIKQVELERPKKGIVYYTDNRLDPIIMAACQNQLLQSGLPITSVSLAPVDFGHNTALDAERGYLTMFRQILAGLEASDADIIFLCEHDVLYHPSHFDFTPQHRDIFYYNENRWMVDVESGKALFHHSRSTSGLCASRTLLLEHYRKRVAMVEETGFTRRMGFEPGTHNRAERVDDYGCESWMSKHPNIDLRHKQNLTPSRWSKKDFRNQRYTRGWTEADGVPGWGETKGKTQEFLQKLVS